MLHDEGIALTWPGVEPVFYNECIDLGRLYASVAQPFQAAFGVDFYPSIPEKAACLFYGLIENHCFHNGNKRTAVLAIDLFFYANRHVLLLPNETIRRLAEDTASHVERGVSAKDMLGEVTRIVTKDSMPVRLIRTSNPSAYRDFLSLGRTIRKNRLNRPTARPRQEMRAAWKR